LVGNHWWDFPIGRALKGDLSGNQFQLEGRKKGVFAGEPNTKGFKVFGEVTSLATFGGWRPTGWVGTLGGALLGLLQSSFQSGILPFGVTRGHPFRRVVCVSTTRGRFPPQTGMGAIGGLRPPIQPGFLGKSFEPPPPERGVFFSRGSCFPRALTHERLGNPLL